MITSLTPEQAALLPVYRDKWVSIGTSVEQGDREEIITNVKAAYKVANLPPPSEFIFLDDPLQGMLEAQRRLGTPKQYIRPIYGQHDAAWLGFYDFMSLLTDACEPLNPLIRLAQITGWWWPLSDACIVTPKPSLIHLDTRGRLHCANGPAIAYPSGWSMYLWHGLRVNERLIKEPITIEQIKTEKNVEIRRMMVERYGYDAYIKDSGAKAIHKDDWGTLWSLPDSVMVVEVLNTTAEPDGTFKTYLLRVRPTMQRAREAIASTFRHPDGRRFTEEEYIRLSTISS